MYNSIWWKACLEKCWISPSVVSSKYLTRNHFHLIIWYSSGWNLIRTGSFLMKDSQTKTIFVPISRSITYLMFTNILTVQILHLSKYTLVSFFKRLLALLTYDLLNFSFLYHHHNGKYKLMLWEKWGRIKAFQTGNYCSRR